MPGKLENILLSGACIPEEMLMDYLDGKLTPRDMHLVEKHLLECEFCSEALEGMKGMNRGEAELIFADLDKKINDRIATPAAKVIPIKRDYRIAAVVSLLILSGATFWFLKNKQQENMIAQFETGHTAQTDSIAPQLIPQVSSDQHSVNNGIPPAPMNDTLSRARVPKMTSREETKDVPPVMMEDAAKTEAKDDLNEGEDQTGLVMDNKSLSKTGGVTLEPTKQGQSLPAPPQPELYSSGAHKKEHDMKALNMTDEEVAAKNYRADQEIVVTESKSLKDKKARSKAAPASAEPGKTLFVKVSPEDIRDLFNQYGETANRDENKSQEILKELKQKLCNDETIPVVKTNDPSYLGSLEDFYRKLQFKYREVKSVSLEYDSKTGCPSKIIITE